MRVLLPKNHLLTLTCDTDFFPDGMGGQIQRIWGTYASAKRLNLGYVHATISDVVPHPLDPWKSDAEKFEFIDKLNREFDLPSTPNRKFDEVKTFQVLTRRILVLNYIQSFLTRKSILLRTFMPLKVSAIDLPYDLGAGFEKNLNSESLIVLHIRNPLDVHGVPDKRLLDISYFLKLLDAIKTKLEADRVPYRVVILTDLPKHDFSFPLATIPKEKLYMWFLTDEQAKKTTLEFKGVDIKNLYFKDDSNVEVIHGGDPLAAVNIMAAADYLVMSRSSLSSVGGMLNRHGKVIRPPDFIYLSSKEWVNAREFIRIENKWRFSRFPKISPFIPELVKKPIRAMAKRHTRLFS